MASHETRLWLQRQELGEKNRRDKRIMVVETRTWGKEQKRQAYHGCRDKDLGKEQKRQAYHGCRDKNLGKRTEETSVS